MHVLQASLRRAAEGRQHLEHPGGWVDALLDLGHPLDVLEVGDQLVRVLACGAVVDDSAPALEQQQLVEGLEAAAAG